MFTIYDARTSFAMWFEGGVAAVYLFLGLFIAFSIARAGRSAAGLARLKKNPIGLIAALAPPFTVAGLFGWFSYTAYLQSTNLTAGRFLDAHGFINDIQIVRGFRYSDVYFEIDDTWFRLPYAHPRDCIPQTGAFTNLKFEPQADLKLQGLFAHTVLWMQLTSPCEQKVWG